ncbi:MAG: hypothetical protein ACYDFT_01270 [Thermoplasmata archaeon]
MPGAPNKPPESAAPPTPPHPKEEVADRVLRRLAPSREALRLPSWRGTPSAELTGPLAEAERLFTAGDLAGAEGALDRLSVRFAEPRWPSLPEPFRGLRVSIPAPQPPQWDPDHALPPEAKEERRWQKYASQQLLLARGSLELEASLGTDVADLKPLLEAATAAHGAGELGDPFWSPLDRIWTSLRERVPPPGAPAPPPVPASGATHVP